MTEATTKQDPIALFRQAVDKMGDQFAAALPRHITVERFKRTLLTAVQTNADLLTADRRTLLAAAMRAAQMGLLPDGREGAIVTFSNRCQFMPMFAGILKLIRNSGELATIDAQMVHKQDKFTYHPGIDLVPVHEPDWFGERGDAIGVYAVAKMKDGSAYVEIMSRAQVEQVRNVSRSKNSGPWVTWADEMWRKTVIRRLAKRLPLSTDLDGVLHEDDELFQPPADAPAPAAPAPAEPPPAAEPAQRRPSRLQRVADQAPAQPPEPPAPPPVDPDTGEIGGQAPDGPAPGPDDDSPI